jgi:O-acetylhomoserine/O-acetylserine sulfhydrylase-like pyridoxal-dependent enzyme
MSKHGFNTKAIHAGQIDFKPASMVTPIYQSVSYFDSIGSWEAAITPKTKNETYKL